MLPEIEKSLPETDSITEPLAGHNSTIKCVKGEITVTDVITNVRRKGEGRSGVFATEGRGRVLAQALHQTYGEIAMGELVKGEQGLIPCIQI